jgi:adenylate cyclase
MPHRTEERAILFADISGSTRLYETYGDGRASEMVASCLKVMTDTLPAHGGTLIRTPHDVYGDAVNVAARITEVARARQTIEFAVAHETQPE